MVHSLYRYVTRRLPGNKSRKAPGWYVQGPRSKVLQGPFEEELQAAASIAKTLKVKLADLQRSGVRGPAVHAESSVSRYRYVTKRVMRGITYWIGQPSKGRQKLFRDMEDAAAWTAKQRKTITNALLKGSALHSHRQYQHRLATVVHIYGDGSEVPGDLEYLQRHAASMERIMAKEPAIEILDIQGKYGPFRKVLAKTFRSSPPWSKVHKSKVLVKELQQEYEPVPASKVLDLERKCGSDAVLRAYHLLAVLRQTLIAVQGEDLTCWVKNCGRNVSHHAGFIPMLLRYKLLQKVDLGQTLPSLDLGSITGQHYHLRSDNLVEVLSNLCQLIRMADAIKEKLPSVQGPWSCSAWSQSFRILSDVVEGCPCPGMRDITSYLPLWTMRGMLLRRMYAAGASQLRRDASLWEDFAAAFPDQKKMLEKIVKSEPGLTCTMALRRMEYKGPPELLTMYLCFMGGIDSTSTAFIIKNTDMLARARAEYKKDHRQNPVLLELVKIVKERMCQV